MRDDELDRIIDAGLSTYAEPRSGIEQRVLEAVAAKGEQRGLRAWPAWQVWAMGLSMAACLLIAVTVGVRVVEAPQVHNEHTANNAHAPVVNHPSRQKARSETSARVAVSRAVPKKDDARTQRLPKKELFPTPQPLSPEMQALVRFATESPEKQRQAFAEAQARADEPIRIAPLRIAPLEISDKDGD